MGHLIGDFPYPHALEPLPRSARPPRRALNALLVRPDEVCKNAFLWKRRPRREKPHTHPPSPRGRGSHKMQGIPPVGAAPSSRSSLADHAPSPRGRGSYKMQGNALVGATPPSRSSLADHQQSPRGRGSHKTQGNASVGATPSSRSSLADHPPSPQGRGSYKMQSPRRRGSYKKNIARRTECPHRSLCQVKPFT